MALKLATNNVPRVTSRAVRVTARWQGRGLNLVVPALDLAALAVALLVVPAAGWAGVALVVLVALGLATAGSYRVRISPRLAAELPSLAAKVALPAVPLAIVVGEGPTLIPLLKLSLVAAGLVGLARLVSYAAVRVARASGLLLEPTLIIGAGKLGQQVAETLHEHQEYGLVPVGFLDGFDDSDLLLPVLDDVENLDAVLREFEVRRVIVAFGSHREERMIQVLRACGEAHVEVHVLPRFFELGVTPAGRDTDDIWGIPLLRVKRSALRTSSWRMKRVFDVVVAGGALVACAPVFIAAAVAVRLSSSGPVLFRQKRVGQRGQLFELLKFRTLREVESDTDVSWYDADDDRRTWIGELLRKTSVDELPQLLNVVRGDMSLVGPRPERPHFVDQFNVAITRYDDRHRVPVGMTGWAQIHGLRGDTSIEDRARFDNHYVEHWSLWTDVVILIRTVAAVVREVVRPER